MKKEINAIAIIPARAGSKGIPRKNMAVLAGKPLIEWTIEASLASCYIWHTLVTSDDKDILEYSRRDHLETINRPEALAQDDSTTEPVMLHALQNMNANVDAFDYVVLLQPTSPLRTALHIDQAFECLREQRAESLISVVEPHQHPYKMFISEQGYLKGAFNDDFPFRPRQDFPPAYAANGAIYIVEKELFLSTHGLLQSKTIPFVMDADSSMDIDTPSDLKRAEALMRRGKGHATTGVSG